MKKIFLLSIFCFSLFFFLGCTSIKEAGEGFLGISTKALEEGRKDSITKTFDYDYFTIFTKVLDILKSSGAYIYKEGLSERMIAIYVSREDTTPVGIFFQEIAQNKTVIEVSSLSTYAKELIAEMVFSQLEKIKE